MKLAFQIIFMVVFFPPILYIMSRYFYYPESYTDKLYVKIDDKNRLCFYIDSSYPIVGYGYATLSIYDESNNSIEEKEKNISDENYDISEVYKENNIKEMWSFPTNKIYPRDEEFNFSLLSFYGEQNCMVYGNNRDIKGLKKAKPLKYDILYYASMSLEFNDDTHGYFEVYFKLQKNLSNGKMQVEVIDKNSNPKDE